MCVVCGARWLAAGGWRGVPQQLKTTKSLNPPYPLTPHTTHHTPHTTHHTPHTTHQTKPNHTTPHHTSHHAPLIIIREQVEVAYTDEAGTTYKPVNKAGLEEEEEEPIMLDSAQVVVAHRPIYKIYKSALFKGFESVRSVFTPKGVLCCPKYRYYDRYFDFKGPKGT